MKYARDVRCSKSPRLCIGASNMKIAPKDRNGQRISPIPKIVARTRPSGRQIIGSKLMVKRVLVLSMRAILPPADQEHNRFFVGLYRTFRAGRRLSWA